MNQQEFFKRYVFDRKSDILGEGGFGIVFKAFDNYRDRWVAIKQSTVKIINGKEFSLAKEVELSKKLPDHPNIAHYENCYRIDTPAGEFDFGILQYYDEGNLTDLLRRERMSERQRTDILKGILVGLKHLHKNGQSSIEILSQEIY